MEGTKVVLDVINKVPEIKTVFKYWYDDNAFKSSFLHALSSVFYGIVLKRWEYLTLQ